MDKIFTHNTVPAAAIALGLFLAGLHGLHGPAGAEARLENRAAFHAKGDAVLSAGLREISQAAAEVKAINAGYEMPVVRLHDVDVARWESAKKEAARLYSK